MIRKTSDPAANPAIAPAPTRESEGDVSMMAAVPADTGLDEVEVECGIVEVDSGLSLLPLDDCNEGTKEEENASLDAMDKPELITEDVIVCVWKLAGVCVLAEVCVLDE